MTAPLVESRNFLEVEAALLDAALSRAEAAEAEVKIGAHLVATVGDKNRELENKLAEKDAEIVNLGERVSEGRRMDAETIDAKDARIRELEEPRLAREQPCGCIVCRCEGTEKCYGCGAKNCGTHPPGHIPNPVYVDHPIVALQSRLSASEARVARLKKVAEAIEVRSPVAFMSSAMEDVLKQNDHKGGWEKCSINFLMSKLDEEHDELRKAMIRKELIPEEILHEAVDIANVAMMIADNWGGLQPKALRAALDALKEKG